MIIYWFNIVVLLGTFLMAFVLFMTLFQVDSVAYTLTPFNRLLLKAFIIMLCVGQLHAMEGDKMNEVNLHDLMRDLGVFGLVTYVHVYLVLRKGKKID